MTLRGPASWSNRPPDGSPGAAARAALLRDAARDVGLAGVGLAIACGALAHAAGLGLDYPLKALLVLGVAAALILRSLAGGAHPHPVFGAANRVTLLRVALGAMVAALIGEPAMQGPGTLGASQAAADAATAMLAATAATTTALAWGVVVAATVAAVLDAVDGPLARRSGLSSDFGARFDMESDAAFTLVLAVLVWQTGQAGAWILAAGLMRYAFVAAARAWPWLDAPLPASRRRQTVCVVQITSLVVCLGPVIPPSVAAALAAASLALLVLSFAVDVRWLARARRRPPEP